MDIREFYDELLVEDVGDTGKSEGNRIFYIYVKY